MCRDRQRFQQRGNCGIDSSGKRMQVLLGDTDELSPTAVDAATHQFAVVAQRGPTQATIVAVSTGNLRIDRDDLANLNATTCTWLNNFSGELVANDEWKCRSVLADDRRVPVPNSDVCAADPTCLDLHQSFAKSRFRCRQIDDGHRAGLWPQLRNCFHL